MSLLVLISGSAVRLSWTEPLKLQLKASSREGELLQEGYRCEQQSYAKATRVDVDEELGCCGQVTDASGEAGQKQVGLKLQVSGKGKPGRSRQVTDASGEARQKPLGVKLKASVDRKPSCSRQLTGVSGEAGQKPLGLKLKTSGKGTPGRSWQVIDVSMKESRPAQSHSEVG
ncbi:hypothetical protein NDU88_007092 [Pleurodeles waltl]|uniref:Uncharacterized protein n=1 Tax=Pleurodeles waltl TaxID=8319 RepID=A0AAV7UMW5_PLEWA|nr:hypothetical protein NDU88_007092 [Pleurodeles waltl]